MPEYLDILNESLADNCHRIADLCELRNQVIREYDERFAKCRSLDEMLSISLTMSATTTVIDSEIELLSRGSKKLMSQIEVWS